MLIFDDKVPERLLKEISLEGLKFQFSALPSLWKKKNELVIFSQVEKLSKIKH